MGYRRKRETWARCAFRERLQEAPATAGEFEYRPTEAARETDMNVDIGDVRVVLPIVELGKKAG